MSYFLIGDNNMFKKIFYLLRRVFFSFVILYGFNTIGSNFNLVIPINIITLTSITLLGFPALLSLILLLVIAF
ncbi:hypothetical protein EGW03_01025 [bacterium]|jgi:hypothetical protein|nr:hypothetical protein [bacterium]